MYELKRLSKEAVPSALERAERYRLLNEPHEAESICLDVLEVDPDNQQALKTLLLACTDGMTTNPISAYRKALEVVPRLEGEYRQAYYNGLICERRAKASLHGGGPASGFVAYDWFEKALKFFDRAIEIRPAGNDEALLRWNTCVRILKQDSSLRPEPEERFQPMMDSLE